MTFLELVDKWVKEQGWWSYHQVSTLNGKEDGYLDIARRDPLGSSNWPQPPRRRDAPAAPWITLWADGAWEMYGDYPERDDQKLHPADPDFFLNLKYLIVTKT